MENKKVLLGMSGGVDSSVSALLLKQQGYEVIGTTLELFAGSSCCNINTYIDAKNVCSSIGIPHFTYDYKEEFKNIKNFVTNIENDIEKHLKELNVNTNKIDNNKILEITENILESSLETGEDPRYIIFSGKFLNE